MCHVLIIEDEALIAMSIQDILVTEGAHSFDFAETEDQAIDLARCRRPDVITSDVMLREGTGPGAVATIQREMGPLPVLFITASPERCQPCDRSRILAKPISDRVVREAFRGICPD